MGTALHNAFSLLCLTFFSNYKEKAGDTSNYFLMLPEKSTENCLTFFHLELNVNQTV